MARTESSTNGIIEGVIWKRILIFFFPILLGTLFQQMYNTVDAVIVGRFVGKEALAAVGGSAAQILNLIIGFFVGLSSGATVIVSQFYGADEKDGVSRAVHTGIMIAVAGGALMTVIGLLFAPTLLKWMNTPADTLAESTMYLRIVFLSMIPAMIYNIGSGILRAVGDSKRPLYFLMICCIVNVALDLVFVLVLNMGVVGVAVATSTAQIVSAVLICRSLSRTEDSYRLYFNRLRMDRELLVRTVRIGLPAGLQSVMYALSNMIITTTINGFGTSTVAAWVALGKVDGMFWMILSAFGVSITTFVGQNYGARRYDRVRKSISVCTMLTLISSWLFSVVCLLFGRPVFRLFSTEAEVLEIAARMLMYMAPCYWLFVPIEMLSGSLRGMGDTVIPTVITAMGICVFRTVWMFTVVPVWHEILAITISYPISWILTSAAFIVYYNKVKRQLMPGI
ncbi:MAG: MATE family efflux transporter [Clostridia bacterium]|nr:MATE family efflux transporter [Clostridia bacterium]